jgi:hypothetical protein
VNQNRSVILSISLIAKFGESTRCEPPQIFIFEVEERATSIKRKVFIIDAVPESAPVQFRARLVQQVVDDQISLLLRLNNFPVGKSKLLHRLVRLSFSWRMPEKNALNISILGVVLGVVLVVVPFHFAALLSEGVVLDRR